MSKIKSELVNETLDKTNEKAKKIFTKASAKAEEWTKRVTKERDEMLAHLSQKLNFRKAENNDFGDDISTMVSFRASCKSNMLTDHDGYGQYAGFIPDSPEGPHFVVSNLDVYPSYICHPLAIIPAWATHVAWYNK